MPEKPTMSLNLPTESLESMVASAVAAQIAVTFGGNEGDVVRAVVDRCLAQRVKQDGTPATQRYEMAKSVTWIEWQLGKSLREAAKEQIASWINDNAEGFREIVRAKLDADSGKGLADAVADGAVNALKHHWRIETSVKFTRTDD